MGVRAGGRRGPDAGDCPRVEGKAPCKRARCEHGDICAVHCATCSPNGTGPRRVGSPWLSSARKRANKRERDAAKALAGLDGSKKSRLAEVEEHEGLVRAHAHLTAKKVWELAQNETFADALDEAKFRRRVANVRAAGSKAKAPSAS